MSEPGAVTPGRVEEDVAGMRRSYRDAGLDHSDLAADWLTQFDRWFTDAAGSGLLAEPNAMVLATASPDAAPSARTVLLKAYDTRGLVFYTNYRSRKGQELAANPAAALVFSWPPLARQIVIHGRAERLDREESTRYFHSRPRESQLGAVVSPQSRVIPSREVLDAEWERLSARYPEGTTIPMPEHWGGVRVVPDTVEFWQGRAARLHDRLRYRRRPEGDWAVERLAP